MVTAQDIYQVLQTHGETINLLVPFLLVVFLVHLSLKPMRQFDKKSRAVIAVVMGVAFVMPHVTGTYPECWDLVKMVNEALPSVGLIILGLLVFYTIIGIIWSRPRLAPGATRPPTPEPAGSWLIPYVTIVLVGWVVLSSGKNDVICPRYDLDFIQFALVLAIVIGIPYLLFRLLGSSGDGWFNS